VEWVERRGHRDDGPGHRLYPFGPGHGIV
jgi:hypothetical protein